jgi:hypothetical protein
MLKMLLGSPALRSITVSTPQPTTDVTDWETYDSPDDDIHAAILAVLKAAPDGTICTSSQFGFTSQDIANEFARLASNPFSRYLFDKSQEAGPAARPVVQALVQKLSPDQWAIGTSKKAGQILHAKAIALTYPWGKQGTSQALVRNPGLTITGSFNLSGSANEQFNIIDIVTSPSRTALFRKMIESMFVWVKTNEGGNQP